MSSLFIQIVKNKSSTPINNYNIYSGFYKISNHVLFTPPTTITPQSNIYNISYNNNNNINNNSNHIINNNSRFYSKHNKFVRQPHKPNRKVSLISNILMDSINSSINSSKKEDTEDSDKKENTEDSNSIVSSDNSSFINSSLVGNSNSSNNISNNISRNISSSNNISNNIGSSNNISNNISSSNNSSNNSNNNNEINLLRYNSSDSLVNSGLFSSISKSESLPPISIELKAVQKATRNDIYYNPKQFMIYKPLVVVRIKDNDLRKDAIQELKTVMPKSTWKTQHGHPNLLLGNINTEVYRDFINNNFILDKYDRIQIIDSSKQPFIGFSKQVLPNSIAVNEKSLQGWVEKACEFIVSNYTVCKWKSWRIHLITPTSHLSPNNEKNQIESLILKYLRKKFLRDLSINYNAGFANKAKELHHDEALVQIMFVGQNDGYISITTPTIYQYFKKMISICPSGTNKAIFGILANYVGRLFSGEISKSNIHIRNTKNYMNPSQSLDIQVIREMSLDSLVAKFLPSRSFVKLVELFSRFERFPSMRKNDTVCDLGSAPGGWTLFSLLQGCCVVSIDKAPLNERNIDLNDEDNLISITTDAFQFDPVGKFDWLIIDMKVPPIKTLQLLEHWLLKNYCQNFIVNLKYEESGYEILNCQKLIQSNIVPLTSYINSHSLDTNGVKEVTLFGIIKPKQEGDIFTNNNNNNNNNKLNINN